MSVDPSRRPKRSYICRALSRSPRCAKTSTAAWKMLRTTPPALTCSSPKPVVAAEPVRARQLGRELREHLVRLVVRDDVECALQSGECLVAAAREKLVVAQSNERECGCVRVAGRVEYGDRLSQETLGRVGVACVAGHLARLGEELGEIEAVVDQARGLHIVPARFCCSRERTCVPSRLHERVERPDL